MTIFGANISLLNKFLQHFSSCLSKKQMVVLSLAIYALFKDYKRNSLDAMAKAVHTEYQKFQYFFSDSQWDLQAIKHKRLEIIQKQRTTTPTKDGLIAIDDTDGTKPFAKKTQGAPWQYCGPLKREGVCNVGVGAVFVSQAKHFPFPSNEFPVGESNSRFKDTIQIPIELFDKASACIEFSATVFNS